VLETEGRHPLADDRARGRDAEVQMVYTVRFAAGELFGEGDHWVMLGLFESYLEEDA
jgi:nitrile hydratase